MLHVSVASADVSSWLSMGGGYGVNHNDASSSYRDAAVMSFGIGVGSTPLASFVGGGLLRGTTYFGLGTDVSLAARVATGGFARGQWGLALDFGPMWRTWGSGAYGRFPFHGMITLGAPWGVQLGLGAQFAKIAGDQPSAFGLVALAEIDLLRLTVMRQGATDRYWENPSPAGGKLTSRAPVPSGPLPGLLW